MSTVTCKVCHQDWTAEEIESDGVCRYCWDAGMTMTTMRSAFWRGVCNTLGIAQIRRYVPTPTEEMEAARAKLRAAINAAAKRSRNGKETK